jgi:1-aminocyclopropane-1-carboxylate deaminase
MTAGLIIGSLPSNKVVAISVLKNNFELEENVISLTGETKRGFTIIHDYHFGGYAKHKPELIQYMNEFYRQTSIPSDFVYTGKLFYAMNDLIVKNYFPSGSRLLLIHSGGLQGNASLTKGMLIF